MQKPMISVCVPTYNGAAYLAGTIESIRAQTVEDYEVVIVDDTSTDDTLAIAESYAAGDSRVRVMRNTERAGSSAQNANKCLAHARGKWVKFLFQDDLMAPTCLERMVEAGAHCKLVVTWHDYIFATDTPGEVRSYYESLPTLASELPATYAEVNAFCDAVLRHWNINFIGPTSSSLIHRDCFARYGLFSSEIRTFPDLEYWLRVGCNEGLAVVQEYLVSFRVHDGSVSGNIRKNSKQQHRNALEPLLLRYLFARAPEYQNLRARALQQQPPVDAERQLETAVFDARWIAIDTRFRSRDRARFEQWELFCKEHPQFADLLQRLDAGASPWTRFRSFLKSHL